MDDAIDVVMPASIRVLFSIESDQMDRERSWERERESRKRELRADYLLFAAVGGR